MKVAFLIEHLDPARGGMERSASEFVTELVGLGVKPHVVTQTVAADFALCPVTIVAPGGWGRAAKFARFIRGADIVFRSEQWDVVHAVPPCLRCDLYQPRSGLVKEALERSVAVRSNRFARFLRRLGARLNSKQRLLQRLERNLLGGPNPPMFAALSRYMRRQAQSIYDLNDASVRDVFNGVTVPLPNEADRLVVRKKVRHELGIETDALVAIFVAHNFRRKGLARLLEAFARPEAVSWQLLVVGKDRAAPYCRQAAELGISQRVRFLGPRSDILALYQASDAGFLPSYYDPCARTVLEGLSLGLPYVTTRYDGASDCIESGVHGFVVESPDAIDQWAETFQQLSDRETRQRMSRYALALRDYLSMRRHAQQIIAIYEEICRNRKGRT